MRGRAKIALFPRAPSPLPSPPTIKERAGGTGKRTVSIHRTANQLSPSPPQRERAGVRGLPQITPDNVPVSLREPLRHWQGSHDSRSGERKPLRVQPGSPLPVFLNLMDVLTTVGLDNQPFLEADKISDKTTDLSLAPKFQPIELSGFQVLPQKPLGIGGISPERSRRLCQVQRHQPPSPLPPPIKGGGANHLQLSYFLCLP